MSVAQTESGAMIDTAGRERSPLAPEVKTPDEVKEVSSEAKFTVVEMQAAVHAAKSEGGRERVAIESERNSLKVELAKVRSELEENQQEIAKFEELIKDDPERLDLVKELRALKGERTQLKVERASLDDERANHAERVKLAEDTLREIAIFEIVQNYEGGSPEKLKDLCDTFGANTEEQYRNIADKLWAKRGATDTPKQGNKPPLKLNSGGGGGALTDAQIVSAFSKDPYNRENKERYLELRARRNKQ